jgi:hypothetical protein
MRLASATALFNALLIVHRWRGPDAVLNDRLVHLAQYAL